MNLYRARTAKYALLLALTFAPGISGCGGDSTTAARSQKTLTDDPAVSSPAKTGSHITKVLLIKQGDEICRRADDIQKTRMAEWEKKHQKERLIVSSVLERALVYAAIPPLATEFEEIAELGLPEGEEEAVETIVSGWKGALTALKKRPSLLLGKDEGPFAAPDKLAKAYGFTDCAKAL